MIKVFTNGFINMIQHNVSLKPYNTLAVDVRATYFVTINTVEQLQQLLLEPRWQKMPKLVLGSGSNVLLTRDFPGLVLHMAILGIEMLAEDDQHLQLQIGAGENWHQLVCYCIKHQYAGIENLSLIPGTVGAAPMQNIGAYGVELQQVFHQLSAVDINDGSIHQFDHAACSFAYRQSVFKQELKHQFIITDVTLRLNKQPHFCLDYSGLTHMLETMGVEQPSLQTISQAVIKIRQQKLPDPKVVANAGSFFKNPHIDAVQFTQLQQQVPQVPFYQITSEDYKIPAAWLIEQCGWKGRRCGDVGVYPKHALVLVNYGGGCGADIEQLAADIVDSVQQKFSIALEPEVNII